MTLMSYYTKYTSSFKIYFHILTRIVWASYLKSAVFQKSQYIAYIIYIQQKMEIKNKNLCETFLDHLNLFCVAEQNYLKIYLLLHFYENPDVFTTSDKFMCCLFY